MIVSIRSFIFAFNIHLILSAPPLLTSFDNEIHGLLAQMSDEEKVGQMTQVSIEVILKDPTKPWYDIKIDPAKLIIAIQEYGIGSIMGVAATGAYSLSQWYDIIEQVQDEAAKSRLKIPVLYGIDSIHGANFIQNAVLFPQAIGLASTFNTTLARELGKIVARQTRASGITWSFHPQVDIG
jgi:beta-glucosidase